MTRTTTRSRAHRAVLLALGVTLVGACADVLGVSGYKDAIEELCGVCSNIPDCRKTLEDKLGAASDADVRAWLGSYEDLGCDTADCNTTGLACFYSAPGNCLAEAGACTRSEACCGFDFATPHQGAGCCGKDDGTCCAHCLTCAEALGKNPPDMDGVCLSHRSTLSILLGCREASCKVACAVPGKACNDCMTNQCGAQLTACNSNQAP